MTTPGMTTPGTTTPGTTSGGVRVDLRSDTLTRPTPGMRAAMAGAEVGDDVYGEDPTVNALERQVADLLGHEAGLFTPSGSLSNLLGVRLLVEPGTELLTDSLAHVVRAEMGAHAAVGGVTTRTWPAVRPNAPVGLVDPDVVAAMLMTGMGPYQVSTAAVAVENTHNFGGGTIQPIGALRRLRELTGQAGVAVHLDGARLWNAHVADGVSLREYGACADTVSICLSKGLGAPVGSVLVSSAERIARARVWRKRLGGAMRQVGVLAAAGRYALAHHVDRLADDHARAQRLARAAAAADASVVDPAAVRTNIVVLEVDDAAGLAADALAQGVAISVLGPRTARMVTHLDVDDAAVDEAAAVLGRLLRERASAGA